MVNGVNKCMRRKRPPYIPAYSSRKYFHRKVRDVEKEIIYFKEQGLWSKVSRLYYELRNKWWGYKKYKK